jgi:hypothetical protein
MHKIKTNKKNKFLKKNKKKTKKNKKFCQKGQTYESIRINNLLINIRKNNIKNGII